MVGIVQCSRIYCKSMSSKGLTSIGRRVDGVWWQQTLHKIWVAHGRRVQCVVASNLPQKLVAVLEGAWRILVARTLHRSVSRQPPICNLAVFF
jgi:hypothetical protein